MPLHLTRWVLDRLSQRWFAGAERTADERHDIRRLRQHPSAPHDRTVLSRLGGCTAGSAGRTRGRRSRPHHAGSNGWNRSSGHAKSRESRSRRGQASPGRFARQPGRRTRAADLVPGGSFQGAGPAQGIRRRLDDRIRERCRPNWQRSSHRLARSATIGPRSFNRQSRIELRIGPLGYEEFKTFLPGGERLEAVETAVRDLVGELLDVDLRIVLARDAVPPARIGTVQLARTAWLAPPAERGDADDMRLRTIVGWRPEMAGVAA